MPTLFRGQRKDNNTWVKGCLIRRLLVHGLMQNNLRCFISENAAYANPADWIFYEVIPETVGEFIGILDIHGNEIFTQDKICQLNDYVSEEADWGFVSYDNDSASFVRTSALHSSPQPLSTLNRYEIIGNFIDDNQPKYPKENINNDNHS